MKAGLNPLFLFFFIFCGLSAIGYADDRDVDWIEIAEDTDFPAIGNVIGKVGLNTFAEREKLQAGDIISSANGRFQAFGRKLPDGPYAAEIYIKSSQLMRTVQVPGGKMGVLIKSVSRPWLTYLRGDIGTRGSWDEDVVVL